MRHIIPSSSPVCPNLALLEAFPESADFRIPSFASGVAFGGRQTIPGTVSLAAGPVGPPRALNMVSGPFHVIVRGALAPSLFTKGERA